MDPINLETVSDDVLLSRLDDMVGAERKGLPHLLAYLAEVDRRGAFKKPGYSSVFEYCTRRLRYSEDAAYVRIQTARAASRFPEVYSMLADGSLSLSTAAKLAPHLTPDNAAELLSRAQGQGKRAVESMLAVLCPRPDTRERVTPLRGPAPTSPSTEPSVSSKLSASTGEMSLLPRPLPAPERFEFVFSGSRDLRDSIERARDLLWHRVPLGELENILLEVLRDYLERHDPQIALPSVARESSRPVRPDGRVASRIRSMVWARDGGRCAYLAPDGSRCQARRGLEVDHIKPRALGGRSDDPTNLRLLCRAHNDFERRRVLGRG